VRRWLIALLLLCMFAGWFMFAAPALAEPSYLDRDAIQGICAAHHSPLPWWTLSAFLESHPDFDVASFLAIMQCESGMGVNCGVATNNPGGIKFAGWARYDPLGFADRPWLLWQSDVAHTSHGDFGIYATMYWGQRAAIRLWYDKGYNALDPAEAALRWYGAGVAGSGQYLSNFLTARGRFVKEAHEYGVVW
jgi:hypothetical protein